MPSGYSNKTGLPFFAKGNKLGKRLKTGKIKQCKTCGKEIYISLSKLKENNFCSKYCANKFNAFKLSILFKGRKVSEETKEKLRKYTKEKSSNWKGGRPKCKDCGKQIGYESTYCNKCKVIHRTKKHWRKIAMATSKKLSGRMPKNLYYSGKYNNIKRGYFNINGKEIFLRSKWEANYALFLDWLVKNNKIIKWEYEKDVFIFEKIKFGTRSYRPDFKITNNNQDIEYHEIKGWMDSKSQTKLKRMKKYYPNIKLVLIDRYAYADICKKFGKICKFIS